MYKLIFFVPLSHSEAVKEAIFATGAGQLGNYAKCAFETQGTGQFLPLAGANPALGEVNQLEKVAELKVELLCTADVVSAAVQALKASHPYEEVAYEVYKLEDF